jgi:hypothetical protein
MRLSFFIFALLMSTALASTEDSPVAKGFVTTNIVLYQDNDTLKHRLPDVSPLADYIKKLQAVLGDYFADDAIPETFHTVVILRPNKIAHVWFVSSKRKGDAQEFTVLRNKLEAVEAIDVQGGPVVFAISAKLAGGDSTGPVSDKNFQPPIPQEWQDATKNLKTPLPMQDDYFNIVCPDDKQPAPSPGSPIQNN